MNKRGYSTLEVVVWAIGAVATLTAYAHSTFMTYREIAPIAARLDRIENKLDLVLKEK